MDENQFVEIRRYLHQHPEVSERERSTSQFISNKMSELWPDAQMEKVGETGLIFTNKVARPINHIAFRCELDALPITEVNDFEYRSDVKGVSHKCGHDGHMAILLRLAALIQEHDLSKTKISLIFQPSEEIGKGAQEIREKSQFLSDEKPDHIFALHNVPGFKKSSIVVKTGVFTPAVISVKTKFIGKTSHAAEPQKGINPTYAIAEIISEVKHQHVGEEDKENMLIISPVEVQIGKAAYGTSAGEGMIGFTFRAYHQSKLDSFKVWYESQVTKKCQEYGLKCEFLWFEAFNSIVNEPTSTKMISDAARDLDLELIQKEDPFPWGEDFGLFTEMTRGAMFGLGAGKDHPALHNPDYDFPDELIKTGSNMFYQIVKAFEK